MKALAITSAQNPRIKALFKIKKAPSAEGFLIEGPNLLETALEEKARIEAAYFTAAFIEKPRGKAILKRLEKAGAELFELPEHLFARLSDTETPQGILAAASRREISLEEITFRDIPLLVVLDGVKEPGNVGAIIRAADAAGADAVILLPGSCSPYNPKALRAGAGSFFHLPVLESETGAVLRWLKGHGIQLCAADPKAGSSIYEALLTKPVAFAFGEEAHGLGHEVRRKADFMVKIPFRGKAESLNVAASCAVILFEALRQRTV